MYHIGCNVSCCDGDASGGDGEKLVTLVMKRDELLYDIRNYAYIEGHVWGEENQHAQHTLVEIGEEGNVDRVNRILAITHAAAVEMLYPYTKEQADEEVIDNKLWTPQEYRIEMRVPSAMSKTTLHLLIRLIHEYMVSRMLYDWLSVTHPDAAQNWLDKAMEAKEEIDSIKHHRTGALRRKCHPF